MRMKFSLHIDECSYTLTSRSTRASLKFSTNIHTHLLMSLCVYWCRPAVCCEEVSCPASGDDQRGLPANHDGQQQRRSHTHTHRHRHTHTHTHTHTHAHAHTHTHTHAHAHTHTLP